MSVSILYARGLVQLIEGVGIKGPDLLAAAGIDPGRLDDGDGRLEVDEYENLQRVALDLTGDPALGIRMGEAATASTYNIAAHLVEHARTLREGVTALIRFYRLMSDRPVLHLRETERTATLVCDEYPGEERCHRFRTEITMTCLYRMVQYFTPNAAPDHVAFEYAPPPHRAEYTRVFDGLERFRQPFTGVVLPHHIMDAIQPNHDPQLVAALELQAEKRLVRLSDTRTYAERIREHVLEGPREGGLEMATVARALGLSVRTLRRRLNDEGQSFQDVVDRALESLAKQLLADHRRAIKEVADALGFSDPTTFSRAFKRWAGTTPKQYRLQHAARDSQVPPSVSRNGTPQAET